MGQDRYRPVIAQHSTSPLVHQPFRRLPRTVAPRVLAAPTPTPPVVVPPAAVVDPATLFKHAMQDVTPLAARARDRVAEPAPATPPRPVQHPDAEALAELHDLINGTAPFDITSRDDFIEGAAVGLNPRLLRRLRAGEFAYQAHIDLHGMISEEARVAVDAFLAKAYQTGKRCVLIVHGRGRNSKDQIPVLKTRLTNWLARGQWARLVLAFTSARSCDGGAGALYVLLRRHRHTRQAIRVTAGAKW